MVIRDRSFGFRSMFELHRWLVFLVAGRHYLERLFIVHSWNLVDTVWTIELTSVFELCGWIVVVGFCSCFLLELHSRELVIIPRRFIVQSM